MQRVVEVDIGLAFREHPLHRIADFDSDVRLFEKMLNDTRRPDPEHAADWAPCQAQSTLNCSDGRSRRWRIEQGGVARLWLGTAPVRLLGLPGLPVRTLPPSKALQQPTDRP